MMITRHQRQATRRRTGSWTPTWNVTLALVGGSATPCVPQLSADALRALGVRFDVGARSCIARFEVLAPTLDAATALAFERWDLIRAELDMLQWNPSSISVVPSDRAEVEASTCSVRAGRRTEAFPSPRFPFFMWWPA